METKEKQNLEVVQEKILGTRTTERKLFMYVWERMANSGIYYIWAENEIEAIDRIGYSLKFCKITVVEINPLSMPVTVGVRN